MKKKPAKKEGKRKRMEKKWKRRERKARDWERGREWVRESEHEKIGGKIRRRRRERPKKWRKQKRGWRGEMERKASLKKKAGMKSAEEWRKENLVVWERERWRKSFSVELLLRERLQRFEKFIRIRIKKRGKKTKKFWSKKKRITRCQGYHPFV